MQFACARFNLEMRFAAAQMPVENKVDPFKPQAPSIPGVPAAPEKKEPERPAPPRAPSVASSAPRAASNEARSKMVGVGIGIAVVVVAGAILLGRSHGSAKSDLAAEVQQPAPVDLPTETPRPTEKLLTGPGTVATTAELAKPWSAKEFLFRGTLSTNPVPAIVVRLPGGELWGFSLREPFGDCELQYVTDLDAIAARYGYRADHPMVVNPCTKAVYDLMRYGGGAPDGGLVRGDIVSGSGVRPPMAIEIRTSGRDVIAVRGE
ncbi:MAG TPA: hypothetical protein VMB02_03065 [Candidatus Aquilonibacter sp.]|nr:hypothetical protein [Candidatus Aquilonibacter sp.]